jgi:hypothetical protein
MRRAADWVYWKTGNVNLVDRVPELLRTIAAGAGAIIVLAVLWVTSDTRSRRHRMR